MLEERNELYLIKSNLQVQQQVEILFKKVLYLKSLSISMRVTCSVTIHQCVMFSVTIP